MGQRVISKTLSTHVAVREVRDRRLNLEQP